MKRADIEENYRVVDGIIVSPGKFEACPVYAPYFWEAMLTGEGEPSDGDDSLVWFDVIPEDLSEFPELSGYKRINVWQDNNGFVYCSHEIVGCKDPQGG